MEYQLDQSFLKSVTAFANEYKNYICISKMVGNHDRIYISDKSDKASLILPIYIKQK